MTWRPTMMRDAPDAEEETTADRKRRVESVVATVRLNTGGPRQSSPQRPGVRIAHLKGNFSLRGCDPDAEAVGGCIDTHIGEAIAPSDLPLLNALQQGLREAEDG